MPEGPDTARRPAGGTLGAGPARRRPRRGGQSSTVISAVGTGIPSSSGSPGGSTS